MSTLYGANSSDIERFLGRLPPLIPGSHAAGLYAASQPTAPIHRGLSDAD
jgi:hypothetical protein